MKATQVHAPALVLPVLLLAGTGTTAGPDELAPLSDLLVDASAQEDHAMLLEADPESAEADDWWDRETLTGDWWGARSDAADAGISFDPYVIFDYSQNTQGGLDTNHSSIRHLLSLNLTLDMTTLLEWESGTVFVDFHNRDGRIASDSVGDYQFMGSYDADGLTQISELWFEYECLDGTIRTKIGKVDANEEFAYTEFGWEFVHGSASYPMAYYPLFPTYPDPATSVNFFFYPDDHWSFSFGFCDGAIQEDYRTGSRGPSTFYGSPADYFLIGEVGYAWHATENSLPGRVAVGGWYHTGTFEEWSGAEQDGTAGFHLVVDQMLWRENPSDEEEGDFYEEGIGTFFQFDYSEKEISDVEHHIGAGVTWRGMLPDRDDDLLGALLSYIHFSDEPDAEFVDDAETAFELMYQAQITPAVTFQPYVQFVTHPGGEGLDDALNVGFRSIVTF